MDKAQAMCFDACLPQSWWEFSGQHAVHVYNCTPLRRSNWKTPYENLHKCKPDVSHLRVFGCSAYVFIPEEVRLNKLAPHAELMTFVGYKEGTKGYLFMRKPSNVLYTATHALFDETLFPNCPDMRRPVHTDLDSTLIPEHNISLGDDSNN
jgi:hypothetical protein